MTNNDERSETLASGAKHIPERDEILEDFISLRMKEFKDVEVGLYILDAMRAVAAFSARRAREKAISECVNKLSHMVELETAMRGENDLSTKVLKIAMEYFQELKSQPQ